jgi:hypothetical protein
MIPPAGKAPDYHYNPGLFRDVAAAHAGQPALRFAEHTYTTLISGGRPGHAAARQGCRRGDDRYRTHQAAALVLMLAALAWRGPRGLDCPAFRASAILEVCG